MGLKQMQFPDYLVSTVFLCLMWIQMIACLVWSLKDNNRLRIKIKTLVFVRSQEIPQSKLACLFSYLQARGADGWLIIYMQRNEIYLPSRKSSLLWGKMLKTVSPNWCIFVSVKTRRLELWWSWSCRSRLFSHFLFSNKECIISVW